MSLQLFNMSYFNNYPDIKDFRLIAEEFSKYYYTTYDNNFLELSNLCIPNTLFTYLDTELIGFNKLLEKIRYENIFRFNHKEIHINFQPVGNSGILISSHGTISLNDSIFENKFTETILINRDDNNRFYIVNSIFKLN